MHRLVQKFKCLKMEVSKWEKDRNLSLREELIQIEADLSKLYSVTDDNLFSTGEIVWLGWMLGRI